MLARSPTRITQGCDNEAAKLGSSQVAWLVRVCTAACGVDESQHLCKGYSCALGVVAIVMRAVPLLLSGVPLPVLLSGVLLRVLLCMAQLVSRLCRRVGTSVVEMQNSNSRVRLTPRQCYPTSPTTHNHTGPNYWRVITHFMLT
jgi:hypothetical protein